MQSTSLINLSHLRLFTMGEPSVEKMMLNEIVTELRASIVEQQQMVEVQDWYKLSRVAHKLKTTLPFIGNEDLMQLNAQIEKSSRNNENLEQIPAWSAEFLALVPEVMQELESILK